MLFLRRTIGVITLLSLSTLVVFSQPVSRALSQDSIPITLTVIAAPSTADILLLPTTTHNFNPTKNAAVPFGRQNLTIGIQNEGRVAAGTCTFRIKPYGSDDTNYSSFTSRLTIASVSYTNSTCETTLPAAQQTFPKWDIELRLVNTDTGYDYGADISYFFLYGPIGAVNISATAL